MCAFFLFEDAELCYTVGRGFPSRDQNIPLPAEERSLVDVLRGGEHAWWSTTAVKTLS